MIEIRRRGKDLEVGIDSGLPNDNGSGDTTYLLRWACVDTQYASLLADRLNERLRSLMGRVRRNAYTAGYKDGRAKRMKQTSFRSGMTE